MKPWLRLSALLQYPDEELLAAAAGLPAWMRETPLRELQAAYVRAFDFDRRASLHLTYHTYGDRRQRGLELVRLKRRYTDAGLPLEGGELPDYLPVLLEFLSMRPAKEARAMLADCAHIVRDIGEAVRDRGSRYHAVPAAVLALAGEAGLGKPREQPAETAKSLDEEWAEAEVVFGPAANPCASARPPVSVVRVVPRDTSRSLP